MNHHNDGLELPFLFEQLETAFEEGDDQGREIEAQLIARARAGDHAAFGALYRRYVAAIHRYCWLHTGGPQEEVEDLTSNVFLRAWQSIGRYEDRGKPFLAWLHTIARNLVIDHMRHRGRTTTIDFMHPATGNIDDDVVHNIEYEEVRQALQSLTDDQRQVVIYRFLLGYSGEETAAVMGKRAGAIRALQLRALQALRHVLRSR